MNRHAKGRPMQILFNKTIDQCRRIGARGGRARVRNLRVRNLRPAPQPEGMAAPSPETAAEAIALLDRQFPWLIGEERSRRPERNGIREARAVL
jgi:hypothetical protein